MCKGYRIFIAGIIQGSRRGLEVHNQTYRYLIKDILRQQFPKCNLFCPVENHPNSILYDDEKAKHVFFDHLDIVRQSHGLIVYLPEASMGSSIEMWESYQQRIVTITITPMVSNWVIRFLSDRVCETMDCFKDWVKSGEMGQLLHERFPEVKEE